MSVLHVKLEGTSNTEGAPVAVEVINSAMDTVAQLAIPVGGTDKVEGIPPGRYLIRAHMPSGYTTSSRVQVEGNKGATAILALERSPHEWLGWQHFLGNIGGKDVARRAAIASVRDRIHAARSQFGVPWLRIWSRIGESWSIQEWPASSSHREAATASFQIAVDPTGLHFLQVGVPSFPWRFVAVPPSAQGVNVLVRRPSSPTEISEGLVVRIVTQDRQAETLLHYLVSGNSASARAIGNRFIADELNRLNEVKEEDVAHTELRLRDELVNPVSAAIGGYYLLQVGEAQRLHDWPRIFANWIDWLPDFAIIHAWQLLQVQGVPEFELALKRLIEASERGVPVYTVGLRLLYDGLKLFAEDPETPTLDRQKAESALKRVTKYARAADWSQTLTTFYGSDPGHPSRVRRYGIPKDQEDLILLPELADFNLLEDIQSSIDAVFASVQAEYPALRHQTDPEGNVTILFTDIEGSTEMPKRLGDQRWLELLREHNAIVREQVVAHEGIEVKSEGDGFMLAFQSARRAVQSAAEMQRAFAHRNQSAEEPIRVRIGLHTGEAIKEAHDFYGKNVILAARIAGQAGGGEILVSSLLKELTESAGDIEFGEGREVELKGLGGPHKVHHVKWR